MTTKHTEGKWTASGLTVQSFGRSIIAECPVPQNGGVFECTANAALISQAPALAEVARAIVALWPVVPPRKEPKATPEVLAVWRAARAVLKAAGVEP